MANLPIVKSWVTFRWLESTGKVAPIHFSKQEIDRVLFFIIPGILTKIQKEYQIGDAEGGALQTAFVVSYMIFAPIFGYLGDRHNRKAIMAFGVFIWTIFTIIGSFMPVRTLYLFSLN